MNTIVYRKEDPQVYKTKIRTRLKGHEKQVKYVYVDVAGVPTVSSGVALVVIGSEGKWVTDPVAVKSVEKATGTPLSDKQKATLQQSADNLNAIKSSDPSETHPHYTRQHPLQQPFLP